MLFVEQDTINKLWWRVRGILACFLFVAVDLLVWENVLSVGPALSVSCVGIGYGVLAFKYMNQIERKTFDSRVEKSYDNLKRLNSGNVMFLSCFLAMEILSIFLPAVGRT